MRRVVSRKQKQGHRKEEEEGNERGQGKVETWRYNGLYEGCGRWRACPDRYDLELIETVFQFNFQTQAHRHDDAIRDAPSSRGAA